MISWFSNIDILRKAQGGDIGASDLPLPDLQELAKLMQRENYDRIDAYIERLRGKGFMSPDFASSITSQPVSSEFKDAAE
eukprot:2792599-Pyramimonas_sp.AAC.1